MSKMVRAYFGFWDVFPGDSLFLYFAALIPGITLSAIMLILLIGLWPVSGFIFGAIAVCAALALFFQHYERIQ